MVSMLVERVRYFLLASMLLAEKIVRLFAEVRTSLECQNERTVLLFHAPTYTSFLLRSRPTLC